MAISPTAINPNTGKSNADVMASSNEVAARAAAMIGKGWQAGTFNDSGKGIGGKVISSDSVLQDRNMTDAVNEAGNALVTSPSDGQFSLNPTQTNYMNMMFGQQDENIGMYQDAMGAVDLMYDAQLARSNAQYGNLMKDLQSSFQNQSQQAAQQAAALNPYSQAQGAMTARNFQGAIQSKYNDQSARLQEAAELAQQELAAGNAQAYVEITNAMKQSNQQFQKGMMQFMMDAQSQFQQAQQEERRFGLDVARFGLEKQEFGEGRFMDFVETFGQDPMFRQNLSLYQQTGQISEGLMPMIERGLAAGLSPAETLSIAQYETSDQRAQRISEEQFNQQMGVQWYNAETSRMNAVRQLNEAADKTKTQNTTSQIFNSRAQTIVDKGYEALGKLAEGGLGQTGVAGQFTGWIDASAAGDLESVYNTIRGNISFDQLAQMRAESPTGGALGQVSNFEGQLLMDAEGSLKAGLQRNTQISNLTNIMAAYVNTQTAVSLDAQVEQGLINQEAANQMMLDNMVTGEDVLADFNAQQMQEQTSTQTGVSMNAQSSPAVADYLNQLGY